MKNITSILLMLLCLALSPKAQAVTPAPDGGYAGFNTAEGQNALFSLNSGVWNTALGGYSLFSDTSGSSNTAVGLKALSQNTTGASNTAVGVDALFSNTNGFDNTANGVQALFKNTSGVYNSAEGFQALYSNTTGQRNTATGINALHQNQTGSSNTALGTNALFNNTQSFNTAVGDSALVSNTIGINNTAIGYSALFSNSSGSGNTAYGAFALQNSNADRNCALGAQALQSNTDGQFNTGLGERALSNNSTGSFNVAVGTFAGLGVTTASNVIVIGAGGADVNDSCYIANIWNQPGGSQPVYVNSDGKLGFQVSSRRFKDQVKPLGDASEVIYGLKPVSFRYKEEVEPTRPIGFGLIAEDVEAVCADLVSRDADGTVNSVRYDAVNAMLLNEFLKEHNALIEEQRKLERLEATVTSLVAKVKEQAAQIQKVSTRVDTSRPASQVAVADP